MAAQPDLTVQLLGTHAWTDVLPNLLSVLVGASISLLTTFGLEGWRSRKVTGGLAKAIAAEVDTGSRMLKFRKLQPMLVLLRDAAARGEARLFRMEFGTEYLPITRASVKEIGQLAGDLPFLVSEFLTLASSLRLDIAQLNGAPDGSLTADSLLHRYDQMLAITERGFEVAELIVSETQKNYRGFKAAPWHSLKQQP